MYKGYVPLSVIIDRIYRRKILKDITEDEIIDNTVSLIKLIDAHSVFAKDTITIEISEYRGVLPHGILKVDSARAKPNGFPQWTPIRLTSGNFGTTVTQEGYYKYTYDIAGNIVHASFDEGVIEMVVDKLAMDATGDLLIRNDEALLKAIEYYVAYQHLSSIHDLGALPDKVLARYEQEYLFYVGRAQASNHELSFDEREAISNMLTTLVDNRNHRNEFYENLTEQEIRRRNNG